MMRRRGGLDSTEPGSSATRGLFGVACVIAAVFFVIITVLLSVPMLSVRTREVISDVGLVPVAALVPGDLLVDRAT